MHTPSSSTADPAQASSAAPRCPLQPAAQAPRALPGIDDELVLPLHRRVVTHHLPARTGATELRLYCGDQEVSFDEPALFAFGETLARQSRFRAGNATAWGSGYAWTQLQPLLAELLAQGVLQRAEDAPPQPLVTGPRPAPLPPGPCAAARMWTEGPALMQALTGRALELGWLELVLPVFRVAHAALDSDGRQVGEANVFPKALRLDVPTQWRACIYPGTRFQSPRPMNVSALKAMRQHWPAMMVLLAHVRAAFLRLDPQADKAWTVGRVERLATCVLGLPTYLLVRAAEPVAPGQLHPALSSLFRVSDGLRMVMHQMLFVPLAEATLRPDAAIGSADILAYAERNHSFHSEHGVCAGPQAMVEEFLAVLIDGAALPSIDTALLEPALQQAVAAVAPAVTYALLGLQGHAAIFSLWPAMARAYERLADGSAAWALQGGVAVQAFAQRMAGHVQTLRNSSYLAHESWRAERESAYADMYAQCAAALHGVGAAGVDDDLRGQIAPMLSCLHALADRQLEDSLQARLGRADGSDRSHARKLRDSLMGFLLQLQAIVRVAGEAQGRLNAHLGRAQSQRAFDAADLNLHNLLQAAAPTRLPYLIDELQAALGLHITVDADAICIDDRQSEAPAPAGPGPHSTGMVPAEARANRTQSIRSFP